MTEIGTPESRKLLEELRIDNPRTPTPEEVRRRLRGEAAAGLEIRPRVRRRRLWLALETLLLAMGRLLGSRRRE